MDTGGTVGIIEVVLIWSFWINGFVMSSINEGIELTAEERMDIFVSDDILLRIIPTVNECWKTILTALEQRELKKPEYEEQGFWNKILWTQLKPYHETIREVDKAISTNKPATVLNRAVNISDIFLAFSLSEKVSMNKTLDWIETVKDGWIKVAGMMALLHHQYDFVFDRLYLEGQSNYFEDDLYFINETLQHYFAWFDIKDLEATPMARSSNELVNMTKQLTAGTGPSKDLFIGLKELLRLEGKRLASLLDRQPNMSTNCSGSESLAGKRGRVFRYLPVYVLLHLLNGEFKYYIMRNVASMYRCVQTRICESQIASLSERHLRSFYAYYFTGIVEAFEEKSKEAPAASSIPTNAWRWRCDPQPRKNDNETKAGKRQHVEGVTFARFYDYQTFFVAEEKEISLTRTCRESCDLFDGGYSSIPCEEEDWDCLEEEKDFDCFELRRQGLPCPGKARTFCPNGGIKCSTSKMKKVQVCKGQRDWRHIEWLDRGEGKVLGKKTSCQSDIRKLTSNAIGERSGITKHEPENCEICLCKCYEPLSNRTHRYISLVPQIANIQNQFALVGVKLTKVGSVIYPQIAQAKIKFGIPNVSTVEWVDTIPAMDLSDSSKIFRFGRNSKNILLDDILAPIGHVITGLRFVRVNQTITGDYELESSTNDHVIFPIFGDTGEQQTWRFGSIENELALEVHMTALTEIGDLNPDTSVWKSNAQNTSLARKQISMDEPEEPILAELASLTSSRSNQFLAIQSTSIKKDMGQTPVPFFDTQELIELNNMTLTRGLGLYYKTQPSYGGFIGFRMISLPISDSPQSQKYDLWHSKKIREFSSP